MSTLRKYLAMATVLVLPVIAACGEDIIPPAPTGSIMGQVSIEGMGIDGVSVNLSNGASTTTAGGGNYRFDAQPAGAYTVTISGFPADASFDATSAAATIPEAGGSVTLDFRGSYIRTASIMGTVTVENRGLGGITVTLSGMADTQTATDTNGQYSFTGLRAGTYSVEISGFDMDEVGFGSTSSSATVGVGESKVISFDGTYLRTAGIEGQVSVEGDGLTGVTVSLGGSESRTTTTDAGGRYAFAKLKAGDYAVTISGYDADDYEFASTSENVTLASGETANVPFEGTLLRTAGISGRVSVGGMGMAGVTVSLSGMDDPREATTNAQGQYGFAGLAEGDYVLSMTNPDPAEYGFETERSVTLARGESKIENFEGTSLRTAGVAGMVTVEGSGVSGVTVTLIRVTGATSGDVMGIQPTGENGGYAFGDLLAGIYRVDISGFDAEYAFEETTWQGQVAMATVAKADFTGTIIRTASVSGMVTVEGEGKAGVKVSLAGGTDAVAESATTGADGGYMFEGLRRGDYTVTIENPDAARYSFTATERKVSLGIGQEQDDVSFAGTMLRQGSISGRVHAEGDGIAGVTVTLAGAMEATRETDDQGNYAFTNLASGTYLVSISDWNQDAYEFESTKTDATLDSADDKKTVDFGGTHTRTASVTGKAFIDEAARDAMYTANEPALEGMEIPLKLQGPGLNDETSGAVGMDGEYAFGKLRAGDYRVLVDMTSELNDKLDEAGYSFAGDLVGEPVTVAAGAEGSVNLPFRITIQTIEVGAVMGNEEKTGDAVEGVELALYPTSDDLEDGTNMLGKAMPTGDDGMATFHFARDDDSGPGGEDTDHLVFVKVLKKHDDLAVSDNNVIEVEYAATARTHDAPASVMLLNTAVNIQFWIKSDEDAKDGNMGLEDWAYEYCMPMADDPATKDVDEENTCMAADDDTPAVFMPVMDADGEAMLTDEEGKGTLSFKADPDNLPATVYIRASADQDDKIDMGEMYVQTDARMHEHDGLILPANNDPAKNMEELDKGPVYVSFTTQTLFVGAHRELDDRTGFTDNIGVGGGDKFPTGDAVNKITVRLMEEDSRGRLRAFKYDHDLDPDSDDEEVTRMFGTTGQVQFEHVPADAEVTVVADAGSGMTIIPDDRDWRMVDAYTDEGYPDAFDDGVIVGGFGEGEGGGGARPDVWLCPLQRQEGTKNCSTFAYKWSDGKISGSIDGLRTGDKDVVVTLMPRHSNDEYAADLEDDEEVAFGAAGFEFTGVEDGRYWVKLEGVASKWKADSVDVEVVHNELDPQKRGAANVAIKDKELSATQLRLAIQGVVANDRNEDETVSSTESLAGVELQLFKATVSRSTGKASKSGGVVDETTTNRDGIYEFTQLVEGQKYIVEAVNVPGEYRAVRKRGSLAIEADDFGMVSQAYVAAATDYDADFDGGTPPWWNHARDRIHNGGSTNFVLLWDDGTAYGKVSDPSVRKAHAEATIELFRCATDGDDVERDLNGDGDTDDANETAVDDTDDYECIMEPTGRRAPYATATPNAKGDWEIAGGLLEGNYEVTVRMPRNYDHSNEDGATAGTAGTDGYYETQIAELTTGRGSDDGTETFHIVLDGASTDVTAPTAVVKDGSRPVPGTDGYVAYTTTSVDLTLTNVAAAAGATFGVLQPGASTRTPFESGKKGTWRLNSGGNTLDVEVTAANGYSDATYNTGNSPIIAVHRDRDTRLEGLQIDVAGVGNDIVLDRDDLEDISGFLSDETRRSVEIDPTDTSGGNTTVDLGRRTVAAGTTEVNVQASGKAGSGITVTGGGTITGVSASADVTVTLTITDDGRSGDGGNIRSYRFTIRARSS